MIVLKTFFALALVAVLAPPGLTQDDRGSLSVAARDNTQIVSTAPAAGLVTKKGLPHPSFCPPKSCLYYAGDFDSLASNANALFNSDDNSGQLEGQVWVGVKPDRDVTVTGATFVESFVYVGVGVNPTPFAVQVGTKLGQAGETICNTGGNATEAEYGPPPYPTYSYTIKKLSKPCRLKKGETYYVNLLPTFHDGYGYVLNVEDAQPKNHYGWKNDLNHCYFNGAAFGADYVTCNSQGIGKHGFSALQIALTGKE
jgi:hypothetical protein